MPLSINKPTVVDIKTDNVPDSSYIQIYEDSWNGHKPIVGFYGQKNNTGIAVGGSRGINSTVYAKDTIMRGTLSSGYKTYSFPNNSGTFALTSDLDTKQDTLVSGTNIKTINGNSLLGSGDLTISGGGGNYLPLTGGEMDPNATINFPASVGFQYAFANYTGFGVNTGSASFTYGAGRVTLQQPSGVAYYQFPLTKTGTIALTSDIPTFTDNGDGTMTITANGTTYKVAIVTE